MSDWARPDPRDGWQTQPEQRGHVRIRIGGHIEDVEETSARILFGIKDLDLVSQIAAVDVDDQDHVVWDMILDVYGGPRERHVTLRNGRTATVRGGWANRSITLDDGNS